MVGQDHIVKILSYILDSEKVHTSYLLSGTRGVGKTTIARLFARGLNCRAGDKPTLQPCGECSACKSILADAFPDYQEIDAGARSGVNDIRDVLETLAYPPVEGRYKVYVLDECHMLSMNAFNALLKNLEEPPERVVLMFATTDPRKVPDTIVSRSLQLRFSSMPLHALHSALTRVLDGEKVEYEKGAIDVLARAANGSARDGITLAEQALAYGAGKLTLTAVEEMLGLIGKETLLPLLSQIESGDVTKLVEQLDTIEQTGPRWDDVCADLLELVHERIVADALGKVRDGKGALWNLVYECLISGRRALSDAPTPRLALELACLRAIAYVRSDMPDGMQSVPSTSQKPDQKDQQSEPAVEAKAGADAQAQTDAHRELPDRWIRVLDKAQLDPTLDAYLRKASVKLSGQKLAMTLPTAVASSISQELRAELARSLGVEALDIALDHNTPLASDPVVANQPDTDASVPSVSEPQSIDWSQQLRELAAEGAISDHEVAELEHLRFERVDGETLVLSSQEVSASVDESVLQTVAEHLGYAAIAVEEVAAVPAHSPPIEPPQSTPVPQEQPRSTSGWLPAPQELLDLLGRKDRVEIRALET